MPFVRMSPRHSAAPRLATKKTTAPRGWHWSYVRQTIFQKSKIIEHAEARAKRIWAKGVPSCEGKGLRTEQYGRKITEIWQKPKQQGPINYSASMQSDEIVSR